jgi:queuine tRNA-ribosyltransferase
LTPELAVDIQRALGSDIMMILDDCLSYPASRFDAERSMKRSLSWAERCHQRWKQEEPSPGTSLEASPCRARAPRRHPLPEEESSSVLFGIVQGGVYPDLRRESAERLIAMDFAGYAIGGLAVGEPKPLMYEIIEQVEPYLLEEKPRYLMGVGAPADLVEAVARGVDMFDCVMPTRHARNGWLFTKDGHIVIKHSKYKEDPGPIDSSCACAVCKTFSRAYLRHLFIAKEILSSVLNTIHNLHFYLDTMRRIRQFIEFHRFDEILAETRRMGAH